LCCSSQRREAVNRPRPLTPRGPARHHHHRGAQGGCGDRKRARRASVLGRTNGEDSPGCINSARRRSRCAPSTRTQPARSSRGSSGQRPSGILEVTRRTRGLSYVHGRSWTLTPRGLLLRRQTTTDGYVPRFLDGRVPSTPAGGCGLNTAGPDWLGACLPFIRRRSARSRPSTRLYHTTCGCCTGGISGRGGTKEDFPGTSERRGQKGAQASGDATGDPILSATRGTDTLDSWCSRKSFTNALTEWVSCSLLEGVGG